MDEFNRIDDNKIPPELNGENEFNGVPQNPQGLEFPEAQQTEKQNSGKKKSVKKGHAGMISAFFTSVVAVALIGASTIVPASGAKAEIADVRASDTIISYEVFVEEASKPLKIVAYNDFTRRESDLAAGNNEGVFSGLQPDMQYTIAVLGNFGFGEQTISETVVRTEKLSPAPVTEWRGVTHECTCNVDGYFHFKMDFIDENGWWSDFEATLTDEYGNTASCEFSDDALADQKIDVIETKLIGNTATFIIECKVNGEKTELYRAQVKI